MKSIVAYSLLVCSLHAQGPLAPGGGPAPTQKSLQQIWDKLQSLETTVTQQQQQIALLEQQNGILLEASGVSLPWKITTVAGSLFNHVNPSLAFSPSGKPAIAFRNNSEGSLRYAILNGSTWQTSQIDGIEFYMESPSLKFGADGNPMVAYYSDGQIGGPEIEGRGLTLAKWNGSSWVKTLLVEGNAGFGCDMVISPSGEPTIAYDDSDLNALRLARFVGGSWQFETVTTNFETGRTPSLAFRQDGTPGIAFKDPDDDRGVYFAIKEGGIWHTETIAERGGGEATDEFTHPSLAFSPTGHAAVSYDSYINQGELNYAVRWHENDWDSEFVSEVADWGFHSTLAFNRAGQACIGYLTNPDSDETPSSVAYAVLKGNTWERSYAGSLTFDNRSSSSHMAFAPNGQPAIVFHDPITDTLGFAIRGIFVAP